MRRLVVCCDGTWKAAEAKAPTNIVYISRAVLPVGRDDISQPVFYDPGVGTGTLTDRISGGAFGQGVSDKHQGRVPLADLQLRAGRIGKATAAGLGFDERYLATLLKPDPVGVLHDSKTGLYRFTGTCDRPIGVDPSGCEAVSSSAVLRHETASASHRPRRTSLPTSRRPRGGW